MAGKDARDAGRLSLYALDPETGDIVSHFQYHWNDSWDWAGMNAPTLVEFNRNGKKVSAM